MAKHNRKIERKRIVPIEELELLLKPVVLSNIGLKASHYDFTNHIKDKKQLMVMLKDQTLINALVDKFRVFFIKGTKCVCCGINGTIWALERFCHTERWHLNLYAINSKGEEVLMTKDHIIPSCLGGKSHLKNYQPMCYRCNVLKDNPMAKGFYQPSSEEMSGILMKIGRQIRDECSGFNKERMAELLLEHCCIKLEKKKK